MRTRVWHFLYSRWYDHREAGHPRRSAMWGRLNDLACVVMWPMHRGNGTRRFT